MCSLPGTGRAKQYQICHFGGFKFINRIEVTPQTVIIQAIAYYKIVGNLKPHVMYFIFFGVRPRLKKQTGNSKFAHAAAYQHIGNFFERIATIYNIFYHDHFAIFQINIKWNMRDDLACTGSTVVRTQLEKFNLTGALKPAQKLGCKFEGSIEHHNKKRFFARKISIDLSCHTVYGLQQFLLRNTFFKLKTS